jgi:hypothetical protein
MESSVILAYCACRSSSRFNSIRDQDSRSIIFPFTAFNALIRRLRLRASWVSRSIRRRASRVSWAIRSISCGSHLRITSRVTSSFFYSTVKRSKSSAKKLPSQQTPRRTQSAHFMECGENRQSDLEIAQAEYSILIKSPLDNTRVANTY